MSYIKEIVVNQNGRQQRYPIGDKADKATTLAGYGITDAKITGGDTVQLGKSSVQVVKRADYDSLRDELGTQEEAVDLIAAAFDDLANTFHTHLVCEYMEGVTFDPATTKSTAKMFQNDTRLNRVPDWDFSNVTNTSYMFDGCTALTEADMDLPAVENMNGMFYNCDNLRTANIRCRPKTMHNLFWTKGDHVSHLEEVDGIDFSRCTQADYMFNTDCLSKVPDVIDLGVCTSARALFYCKHGVDPAPLSIPDVDFSNLTRHVNMFCGRGNTLRYPAVIDCSKSTSLDAMFRDNHDITEELLNRIVWPTGTFTADGVFNTWDYGKSPDEEPWHCRTLVKKIPSHFDFSKCTYMESAFAGWTELTEATINVASVLPPKSHPQYAGNPFVNCEKMTKRTYIGLGTEKSLEYWPLSQDISGQYGVNDVWGSGSEEARQTIVDSLLTHSFDRAAAGYAKCNLRISAEVVKRLTDSEKAAIVAKGYTISSI